ncbi:hypothetical protein [Enterobacter kobei]|uniref:hypothetical protein n=1 Tax=Enterobacter kobei TaxID=208224 RepID=UPI002006196A|nr:hypothetical protein [Enterobacter kobei]MCK7086212.1 hypothetical protein [Enterobacter kobei]
MIDNSNLPQRLYYSLPDAAKELGCEVRDLIHYAAIQALQLSIYIPFHHGSPDAWFHLNMPSSKVADIDMFSMLKGDGWSLDFVEYKKESDDFFIDGYYEKAISGFFYIDGYNLISLEFNESADVSLAGVSTLPDYRDGQCIDINFQVNNLKLNRDFLCIRKSDLEVINKNVSMPAKIIKEESNKTAAKKSQIIPALIKCIPEMRDIDLDTTPVSKIISLIEAVAARDGVELPELHRQTWQKYLGR